jgi:hypothetical protein
LKRTPAIVTPINQRLYRVWIDGIPRFLTDGLSYFARE